MVKQTKLVGPNRYRETFGRYFEDFVAGDVYEHRPGRTITQTDNTWFTLLTMNMNPLHFDEHYASQSQHGRCLVNGVLVFAIAFLYTPPVARVVRANVLAQYGEDYVVAEKIIGARTPHILLRHVAINCAAPVLVFCTVMVADAIVFEASLSFIGAGVRPPEPSWGSVIADGKNMVLLGGWWATVFPGLLILITVLSLNILSEGVSDAWAAPAARRVQSKKQDKDALETAQPGSGELVELPGLDIAATRLRERARPLPDGERLGGKVDSF